MLVNLFSNGKGEAGLEVGVDPGLAHVNYIQIPKGMLKGWAAKTTTDGAEGDKSEGSAKGKEKATSGMTTEKAKTTPGWVTTGKIIVHDGKLWVKQGESTVEVHRFIIDTPTYEDIRLFYAANIGHINDADFDDEQKKWIHATRFWATVSGFVMTSKSKEFTIVDDPKAFPADTEVFAEFIADYKEHAWTACAARAASWRKTNHATGGDLVQGFPRRWLNKMGYIKSESDPNARRALLRRITSAYYMATHAASVHGVLALLAHQDTNHWAEVDPSAGLIPKWEIRESARIRMVPNTQVAGTAMVTDAYVCLQMLVREGLAPLLQNIDQAEQLIRAYNDVETHGVKVGTYASWFLDGHPTGVKKEEFNQKDITHAALVGELAIVATKYYEGTTIAGSASLQNAALNLGEDSARTTWTLLQKQKLKLSSQQIVRGYSRIKGASSAQIISNLLSEDDRTVQSAVADYNAKTAQLAGLMKTANYVQVSFETLATDVTGADDEEAGSGDV